MKRTSILKFAFFLFFTSTLHFGFAGCLSYAGCAALALPHEIRAYFPPQMTSSTMLALDGTREDRTYLQVAAAENTNPGATQAFIDMGFPIDFRDRYGETALHLAIRGRNLDAVGALIRAGADTTLVDSAGRKPFDIVDHWNGKIVSRTPREPLEPEEEREELAILLRRLDLNTPQAAGAREWLASHDAYHEAAQREAERIAAETEAAQREEQRRAARTQEVQDRIRENPTFIFTLAREGSVDDMRDALRVSNGRSILNIRDEYGQTPLMYAAGHNTYGVIFAMFTAGVDGSLVSGAGWTALHYAARSNPDASVVALLSEAGADPLAKNSDGQTAMDLALAAGNTEMVVALEKRIDHYQERAAAEQRRERDRQNAQVRAESATGSWVGIFETPAGYSIPLRFVLTEEALGNNRYRITGLLQGPRRGTYEHISSWDTWLRYTNGGVWENIDPDESQVTGERVGNSVILNWSAGLQYQGTIQTSRNEMTVQWMRKRTLTDSTLVRAFAVLQRQ